MPHVLLINSTSDNWRLPADTDLSRLHAALRAAMDKGEVVDVQVEMGDDPRNRVRLVVNGRNIWTAAIVELPEPTVG